MMDTRTGEYRMMGDAADSEVVARAARQLEEARRAQLDRDLAQLAADRGVDSIDPAHAVLVVGTDDQIADLSTKVKLGAGEQKRRRDRRLAQKKARKANRTR